MWRCCSGAILSCVALLCGLLTGEAQQFVVTTEPESGRIVADFPETSNITLVCRVRTENGNPRGTTWFSQTAQDREEGRQFQQVIPNDPNDPNFTISGVIVETQSGNLSDQSVLTIASLTSDLDTAIIFCGFDGPEANFTLRIYYPPVLLDRVEVKLRENEELKMDMANPDSSPAYPIPSQVSWTKDGEEIDSVLPTRVFNYSSIFIGSVEPSDSGVYQLSVISYFLNGSLFQSDTASLTLNVLFGAGFGGEGSEVVVVLEGEMATLVCGTDLTGNPIPNITWTYNNSVVSEGGRISLSRGREEVSLTLDSSTRGDNGTWTCSAQVYDSEGQTVSQPVVRTVELVVVVAPVAPVDISIANDGPTWVYLDWFQPSAGLGNPPLSGHVVTVQEVGAEEEERRFEGSSAEANVTGLQPGTEYIFSVVAVSEFRDVQASSPPSAPANGTTILTVPAPVCSQSPQVVNDRLVVRWGYTHTGGEPITVVTVLFSSDTSATKLSFSEVPGAQLDQVGETEREDSIPLPDAGITYKFSVRAGNSVGGTEVDCPILPLTTGVPARPDPPTVDTSAGDTVFVRVSTPHSGVRDSATDGFQFILQIRNVDDIGSSPSEVTKSESCGPGECVSSVSLSSSGREGGLVDGATYIVSVRASNRYGESSVSGNSLPFTIGGDSNPGGLSGGMIAGSVIGALVIVVLLVLIVVLFLFIVLKLKSKRGESYNLEGGGQGVRVEEVDIGKELRSVDPDKELQYAELEHFQKSSSDQPRQETKSNSLDHLTKEEPVQYATLLELNPKAAANGTAEGGEGAGKPSPEEDKEGGAGEGDKAMTSSTFV